MALVLGIDAAWTPTHPSGVALLRASGTERSVLAAAPSYERFIALAGSAETRSTPADAPDIEALLRTCSIVGGGNVDVVAIDMPISRDPITGRRVADDAVSRAFGAVGAAVHTASASRPGPLGERISQALFAAGFSLGTATSLEARPIVIEVFPLAALIRIMNLPYRPPYKIAKIRRYREYRDKTREQRLNLLHEQWQAIHTALGRELSVVGLSVPERCSFGSASELKSFEDQLDGVICALVGAMFLDGLTQPYGDDRSTIWIPLAERCTNPA